MIDWPLNVKELHPPGDRPGLRARAAELLLKATDAAQAGGALFDLIGADLNLNVFLLYGAGNDGELDLIAHGGISDAEAAIAAEQLRHDGTPFTGHIMSLQNSADGQVRFLTTIGLKSWFGQPLMAGERLLGIIGFGRRWADSFEQDDLAFLQRIARYFALALGQLRSDAALRESEHRLRLGLAAGHLHTYDVNLLTGQVFLSPKVLASLEIPSDQWISYDQLEDTVHPDDWERVHLARLACSSPEGTGAFDEEFRVIRPDGAVRWLHVRAQTFFAGEGSARRAVRLIGAQQDITRSKLAEQRLRDSEERLRLAIEAAGIGTFDYDVERDENIWSPELRAMYGMTPDESIDLERGSRQVHPDDKQRIVDAILDSAAGDLREYSHEYRIFRPDGEMRWLAVRAARLFAAGGSEQSPKRLIGVVQDITEQKLAAERLRESAQRLQLAQELGGVASWEWNHATGEVWVSESYRRIFGLAPGAPIGVPVFQSLLHPDDRERVYRFYTDIADNAERLDIEYRIIRPADREVRWIYGTMGIVRDPAISQMRLFGIALDITDRKRDEERERLLSREVDHRAKNLLSIVQAMVQLTHAGTIPEFVEQVNGRIQALGRVHGLLAASRWEGAELSKLIADELAPFADTADRSRTTGPSIGLKPAAAQSMALVIHELTTNAVKHGALSVAEGRVDVLWEVEPGPDGKLVLHWCESGGPIVEEPRRFGFGMTHIRASVRRQLRGTLDLNWRAEGLECLLVLPASNLCGRTEPQKTG